MTVYDGRQITRPHVMEGRVLSGCFRFGCIFDFPLLTNDIIYIMDLPCFVASHNNRGVGFLEP